MTLVVRYGLRHPLAIAEIAEPGEQVLTLHDLLAYAYGTVADASVAADPIRLIVRKETDETLFEMPGWIVAEGR